MMRGYNEGNPEELKLRVDPFQRIHNLRPIIPNYYNNMYVRYPNHNHIISSYSILNPGQQQYQDLGKQYSIHSNVKKGEEEGEGEGEGEEEEEEEEGEVMVRSRWNPVAEQVRALEELYRCGTRTPSAEQIEEITAELGRYGKIEGKNVFYWFQNHKARERQKRRRDVHQQQVASKEKGRYVGTL